MKSRILPPAMMPNFIITEYFVNFEPWGREAATPAFEVEDSHIALPTAPGLGIDLDEEVLKAHPAKDFPRGRSATDRSALGVGPMNQRAILGAGR